MTKTLSEYCKFQEGYVNPPQDIAEYFDGDIKWLRAVDLNDGFVYNTSRTLSKCGLMSAGKSAHLFPRDSLAISKSGSIGTLGILKDEMCGNRAVINIVVDTDKIPLMYIYYLLKYKRREIINRAVGSIQKNLYVSELETVTLCHDTYEEQNSISEILSSLDYKIAINNKINSELESLAKKIYDYWFIQFDFPDENGRPYKSSGGRMVWNEELKKEIPEGWVPCKLKDFVYNAGEPTQSGEHLRDMFYTPIDEIPKRSMSFYGGLNYSEAKSSLQLYQKHDILIGAMRVYFHRVCIAAQDGITRSTTIVLRPINAKWLGFIFETLNQESTIAYATKMSIGTQQPYVNWDDALDSLFVVRPPNDIISHYSEILQPIIDEVIKLSEETFELEKLRDWLLPMLMNGQVVVDG